MIPGLSFTDPKWDLVTDHVGGRIRTLQARLEATTDPILIYQLQGAIKELRNLIAPPDNV